MYSWGGGGCLNLDVQGQGDGKILDVNGQGEGGLENYTFFMDVIFVSSLKVYSCIWQSFFSLVNSLPWAIEKVTSIC